MIFEKVYTYVLTHYFSHMNRQPHKLMNHLTNAFSQNV